MGCMAKLLSVAAVFATAGAHASDGRFDGLREYIEQAMADWQVPGLAAVAMHEGNIIYSDAFGVREADRPQPIDLETVFALSSTGKAYTATLVGTLVDEGKLAWDDPASDYLDYFRLPDPTITGLATLRDLLSHRVAGDLGVGRLELWAFTGLSRVEVLGRLRHLAVGPQRFRGELQYANPNISAAGQAAGVAAGSTWDELIRERILDAAGMERASTTVYDLWRPELVAPCYMCDLERTPGHTEARIDNIAMPHVATANGPRPIPWRTVDSIAPAGSINSSVLDIAKFVQLHLNRGSLGDRRIVSAAAIAEMHSPQIVGGAAPYPAVTGFSRHWTYGLGWWVTEYRGHKLVMHTGGITGWRSGMVMLPELHLGVALVSNGHGAALPNTLVPALAFVIFDRVLEAPATDHAGEWLRATREALAAEAAAEQALLARRDLDEGPGIALDSLAGTWRHPAFGKLSIDPAAARVRLAGIMEGRLEHLHHDLYRVTWIGPWEYTHLLAVLADPTGGPPCIDLRGFGVFSRD